MELTEKAKSKAQQRYFGMVKAGKIDKPKGMSDKEVDKMASTKHKGLPEKVKENMTFKDFLVNEAKSEFKNKYEIGDIVKTSLGKGKIMDIDNEKRKYAVWIKAKDQTPHPANDKPKDMVFSMGHGDIKGLTESVDDMEPIKHDGKKIGSVWKDKDDSWACEYDKTGASWSGGDSKRDAIDLVKDEHASWLASNKKK